MVSYRGGVTDRMERNPTTMQNSTGSTDYGELFKGTFDVATRTENLLPLVLDALIVCTLGACTLGVTLPPLLNGYTEMAMKALRGEPVKVGDSFKGFERFGPSFVLGLLILVALVVGSIIPVVGTLAVALVCTYAFCIQVERPGVGAVDAIRGSFDLVRAHPVDTLVVFGASAGIGILLSATVIGGVLALAMGTLLTAALYRRFTAGQIPSITI